MPMGSDELFSHTVKFLRLNEERRHKGQITSGYHGVVAWEWWIDEIDAGDGQALPIQQITNESVLVVVC